jgi:hypothetical protein
VSSRFRTRFEGRAKRRRLEKKGGLSLESPDLEHACSLRDETRQRQAATSSQQEHKADNKQTPQLPRAVVRRADLDCKVGRGLRIPRRAEPIVFCRCNLANCGSDGRTGVSTTDEARCTRRPGGATEFPQTAGQLEDVPEGPVGSAGACGRQATNRGRVLKGRGSARRR